MRRAALFLGACIPGALLLAGAAWPVVLGVSVVLVGLVARKE